MLTLAIQAVRVLAIWLAAKAVGVDLSPRVYYVMGPLLFLVMLVPFTINGLAVREAFFVSFLGKLGVERRRRLRDRLPLLRRHDRARAARRGDPRLGGRCAARRGRRLGPWRRVTSTAVTVTLNGLPWIERCLESLRGVRDDRRRPRLDRRDARSSSASGFPDVRVIEQANVGYGGGLNAGFRAATPALLPRDQLGRLGRRRRASSGSSPSRTSIRTRRSSRPRLSNPDGSLQRSVRGFPTLWRLATEYLFLRKLAPRSRALNAFYAGGFDHDEAREVEWAMGSCFLVRRAACDAVGLFDEDFFLFSEETDWFYRFHAGRLEGLVHAGRRGRARRRRDARRAHVRREPPRPPALLLEAPRAA